MSCRLLSSAPWRTAPRSLAGASQLGCALVIGMLIVLNGCINDECQPSESQCAENTAMICEEQNSDSHKAGNPYVWYGKECGALTCVHTSSFSGPKCDNLPVETFPTDRALVWRTNEAVVAVDSLEVLAQGKRFNPDGQEVTVTEMTKTQPYGDSPVPVLKLQWRQDDVPMLVEFHFMTDGQDWWIGLVVTYNGLSGEEVDEVTHYVEAARTPLGQTFVGDVVIPGFESGPQVTLTGADIRAFR